MLYKKPKFADIDVGPDFFIKQITVNAKDVAVVDGIVKSLVKVPSTDADPSTADVYEGYCWRVYAMPSAGFEYAGLLSDASCYDLGPDLPVLVQPLNTNSPVDFNNTLFTWDSQFAPFGYVIWIERYASGIPVEKFSQFVGANKTFAKQLAPASEYHWRISALLEPLPSGFDPTKNVDKIYSSASQTFTTKSQASPEPTPPPSEPQEPTVACNAEQAQGGSQVDSRNVNLGKTSGNFTVTYNTYDIPDKIDVYYEGKKLWSSGCVWTPEYYSSDPSSGPIPFSGTSSNATVTVTPNCNGVIDVTIWQYTLNCP